MKNRDDRSWALATATAIAVAACCGGWGTTAALGADPPSGARGESSAGLLMEWQGTGSCSANSCHNGNNNQRSTRVVKTAPEKGAEYTNWLKFDPHAKAYAVLFDVKSKRIEKNLRNLPNLASARPETDGLCLSCHVHQNFEAGVHSAEFAVSDGVGCEGCHGAAQQWIGPHTQAGWKNLPDEQKAAYGMVPTDNLVERAKMCVGCHVGASQPDPVHGLIDVNHDLIAAGHPRLNFDYGAYLSIYPKHWDVTQEKAQYADYEARAWAIGQVVNAKSGLDLLSSRASRFAETESPGKTGGWPEFTEYSCWSCHHDLGGKGVNQPQGRPGSLPWGTWLYPMSGPVVAATGTDSGYTGALDALREEMIKPRPDPATVAQQAASASSLLDGTLYRLGSAGFANGELRQVVGQQIAPVTPESAPNWDNAAQLYLGLGALNRAMGGVGYGPTPGGLEPGLFEVVRTLQFPVGKDSPAGFTPEQFADRLTILQRQLGQ